MPRCVKRTPRVVGMDGLHTASFSLPLFWGGGDVGWFRDLFAVDRTLLRSRGRFCCQPRKGQLTVYLWDGDAAAGETKKGVFLGGFSRRLVGRAMLAPNRG
jgi:hypothetical protein